MLVKEKPPGSRLSGTVEEDNCIPYRANMAGVSLKPEMASARILSTPGICWALIEKLNFSAKSTICRVTAIIFESLELFAFMMEMTAWLSQ